MSLIVAAAQSTSIPGDISRNIERHLQLGNIAAEHGVRLLVFPELSLTGYELALARPNAIRPECTRLDPLRDLAARADMTVVVGAPVPNDNGALYIGALAIRPDGSVSTYSKMHVHYSEEGVFTSGPGGPMLRVEDANVALAICRDAKQPQHAADAAARGANVYAAGVMVTESDYAAKAELLSKYASEHRMAALMANYSGVTGGDVSGGMSAVWSEDGQLVVASPGAEESLVIARKENGIWNGIVLPVSLIPAADRQDAYLQAANAQCDRR
jgi:predicted amidohydrolase